MNGITESFLQVAALKEEIEQWKRIVVTHVEEIERYREALEQRGKVIPFREVKEK